MFVHVELLCQHSHHGTCRRHAENECLHESGDKADKGYRALSTGNRNHRSHEKSQVASRFINLDFA